MRFIEAIAGKMLQEGENLLTELLRNIVLTLSALHEILTHAL